MRMDVFMLVRMYVFTYAEWTIYTKRIIYTRAQLEHVKPGYDFFLSNRTNDLQI
jgi:hypothetical protein